jgi:group I intron endonuclease
MNIYSSIYRCYNILTGKSYIGYDSNWPSRKSKHIYDYLNKKSPNYNCHFYKALRKYGIENFSWEILYQSWDKKYCLNVMESFFIEQYDSFNNGYNMTKGGEGTLGKKSWLGKKHTEETKIKISLSLKRKIRSEQHSENISKSLKGKNKSKWPNERKERFSKQRKGIKPHEMTEEIRKKISISCSGGNHYSAIPVTINDVKYSCKKEACQKLNLSLYQLNKLLSTHLC